MKKLSIKTQITLIITLIVLLTVGLISILSNIFISKQFTAYKINQQSAAIQQIANQLSNQYQSQSNIWNIDFVHAIGMNALSDGYIIDVYDSNGSLIWDAQSCDMVGCREVMNDITELMMTRAPKLDGVFTDKTLSIIQSGARVGTVRISYYGPYFYNEDDFNFLDRLNTLLVVIGGVSLFIAILIGFIIAVRISKPILQTANVTKRISAGQYNERINEKSSIREIGVLINSVNHLADSLSKQENLRRQLSSDVAHELRTPIATLQTHIEAMTIGMWEPTHERLESCHEEVIRIGGLISDLENVAKLESGNFVLSKISINIKNLAEKVVKGFELDIDDKNLNVSVNGECSDIMADDSRIKQAVINLLSNAIKYTPKNGNIIINLREDAGHIFFSVQDNGIGISENDLPNIFERFYRADKSRNRMTGGSGIGLTVVKSIVEAHGGSISVKSSLNKGSEFIMKLPK